MDLLLNAIRVLAHRGPDDYAWVQEEDVILAHLRLSIIDLSGGQQPLLSFDGRYMGIVNGELYDYVATRQRLCSAGVTFSTKSDSEVLLNLFALEGPKGLEAVSGEFAFIFYDRKLKQIVFGRDPHGIKPLFYKFSPITGELVLSSEVKALNLGSVDINQTYVQRFLSGILVPPETAVQDCYHVLPGVAHFFDLASATFRSELFQALPLNLVRDLKGEESIQVLSHEIKEAVKRRLVADVEVGCYLSGGLDSALITALAVQCGLRPKSFTVGFAEKALDEREKAAAIARHLNIPHYVVELTAKNFFPAFIRSIIAFENPVANPHGCAKNLLSELASKHVKVVLSGEGADEWFGGYAYLRIQKLMRFAKKNPKFKPVVSRYLSQEVAGAGHLDGRNHFYDQEILKYFAPYHPAIFSRISSPMKIRYLTGAQPHELVGSSLERLSELLDTEQGYFGKLSQEYDANVWTSLRTDMFHYILANLGDRQEMSHSLEGRVPFLDPKVTRVAARIPSHELLSGLTEKSPLRQVAKSLLPNAASTKKHAFFAPYRYFMMSAFRNEVESYIDFARKSCPELPWRNVEHFINPPRAGRNSRNLSKSIAIRMALFSVGVIASDLRKPQLTQPRGYRLPETVRDLMQKKRLIVS